MAEDQNNQLSIKPSDTAADALAGALKLSFRLLTVIIVLVVVAFMLTGIRRVKTDEVGIRSRFGAITGTAETGLAYVWPFPVGQLDIVDLSTRELQVDDFWMYIRSEDQGKPLAQVRPKYAGLRPGADGALLTGDGSLLHVQLMCTYGVGRGRDTQLNMDKAVLFRINVDDQDVELARKLGTPLHSEEIVRSVICQAAIRVAARQTAEMLRTDTGRFTADVRDLAQSQLTAMRTGLEIRAVNTVGLSWPLHVLKVVSAVSEAQQKVARDRRDAVGNAQSLLSSTAGSSYAIFVGDLTSTGQSDLVRRYGTARQQGLDDEAASLLATIDGVLTSADEGTFDPQGSGLIPMYADARQAGEEELAERILASIDKALVGATTGLAQTIVQQAQSDRAAIVEPIKGRLSQFRQLLPLYRQSPDLTIARLWADTRDDILARATAEKFYMNEGDGTVVMKINRDPAVARQLQQQLMANEDKNDHED